MMGAYPRPSRRRRPSASDCGNQAYFHQPGRMQKKRPLIPEELDKVVIKYAQNAKAAGLDGVVCSPAGIRKNSRNLRYGFLNRNPGRTLC